LIRVPMRRVRAKPTRCQVRASGMRRRRKIPSTIATAKELIAIRYDPVPSPPNTTKSNATIAGPTTVATLPTMTKNPIDSVRFCRCFLARDNQYRPPHTDLYQLGCSTVAIRYTAEHRRRGVGDKEAVGRYPCCSWATVDRGLAGAARRRRSAASRRRSRSDARGSSRRHRSRRACST
jgi:hypothetical protein